MANIRQTIPAYTSGISEQPDHLKFPGQVKDCINAVPDITKGLFKRPGARRIGPHGTEKLHNINSGGSFFHYYRDDNEGSYLGQIGPAGTIRVWKVSGRNTGVEQTIAYGGQPWESNTSYVAGTRVTHSSGKVYEAQKDIASTVGAPSHTSGEVNDWLFIHGLTAAREEVRNYLQTASPENIQFLSINDTTFVSNRDVSNYTSEEITVGGTPATITLEDGTTRNLQAGDPRTVTIVGTTGTTQGRPIGEEHCAFIELTRTENGRQYSVNINNGTAVTTTNRATRVKIVSDTLDESDGTGHCPGIGTQVFSADYSLNDTSATFATSDVTGGTNNLVTVTTSTPHKLNTGNTVSITATGTANSFTNLPNVTIAATGDNTFTYVADSDQGDHTATTCTIQHSRNNLIFRVSALGQQGVSPDYNANANGAGGQNYRCSYNREIVLLHGGEGWVTGNTVDVVLTSTVGGGPMRAKWNDDASYLTNDLVRNNGNTYRATQNLDDTVGEPVHSSGTANLWEFISDSDSPSATYTIRVEDFEATQINATVSSNGDGLIRPAPTPFDADTAVTAEAILGSMQDAIRTQLAGQGINTKVIGTGLYISSANPFTVEVMEDDIMRVFQKSVNDVSRLPVQCRHGYIVKVANARISDEDDYYLRFDGENNSDGSGSWSECAEPGIPKTLTNMPLVIQRTNIENQNTSTERATFTIRPFKYSDREVGDEKTNPLPSFVGKPINKVIFFRNRLAFLSGENVVLSRPGTFGEPDFFAESALAVGANDCIDIACGSTFPSELFDGIEVNSGLLVFSTNQQFLLSSDAEILNPETAKLRSVSTYNYNKDISPISLGVTVAYVDNSGKFSRFNEMANIRREGEPDVVEPSKIVPTLLPKDVDLLTNSRENSIVLFGKSGTRDVFGFRYFNVGDKRQQQAWFRWRFNNGIRYHFIINDDYYFVDQDKFLQTISLVEDDDDLSITQDNVNYPIHLDNYTTISAGTYNPNTGLTSTQANWLPDVTPASPANKLVVIDLDSNSNRIARYAEATVYSSTGFTIPGDWQQGSTLYIGYLYDYQVDFPTIYPTQIQGEKSNTDVSGTLVLHRLQVHLGKAGLYETTLNRLGKEPYTEVYESNELDEYKVSDAPYVEDAIRTVPVYEKNTNLDFTLKSTHPAPATLRALSWEGSFSPKYYKRV